MSDMLTTDERLTTARRTTMNGAGHVEVAPHNTDRGSHTRMLDGLLDETILRLQGEEAFRLVDEVRTAGQQLRAQPSLEAARQLRDRVMTLSLPQLRTLTRAFSMHFDLINLGEQQTRLRVLRARTEQLPPEPLSETPEGALRKLRERGFTAGQVAAVLERALVLPVFTAHPSEARRRTILEKLDLIAAQLDRIEYTQLTPGERAQAVAAITAELEAFWLTDIVRNTRPTVADEIRHGLGLVSTALFQIVPEVYRNLEEAVTATFPGEGISIPPLLRFGSWIGGDRDGNPNVTPEVTREAVRLHQETVLKHYIEQVKTLSRRLSHSVHFLEPGEEIMRSLAADAEILPAAARPGELEPYRQKCRFIAAKLTKTLERLKTLSLDWSQECAPTPVGVYREPAELRADLDLIAHDLERSSKSPPVAAGLVRDLTRQVDVFGLHMLSLDVRQHAARHVRALDEIFAWAGTCQRYSKLNANERFELLEQELSEQRPLIPARMPFSAETCEIVQTFRTIAAILENQCSEAIQTYITSGATDPANMLEVLLLAREARLFQPNEASVGCRSCPCSNRSSRCATPSLHSKALVPADVSPASRAAR